MKTPLLSVVIACLSLTAPAADTNWPSFRGAYARGVANGFATPTTWDVEKGEKVLWKAPVPGLGHSSPVIWGDRVYLTSAINESGSAELKVGLYGDIGAANDNDKQRWVIYCFNKSDGQLIWERTAFEGLPSTKRHTKATHANSTPATDGRHVVAFFGTEGLHCYDRDGKLVWKKDLGPLDAGYYRVPSAQWGFGSSPVIFRDRVLIQCDVQTNSFIAALSIEDGKELWRTARNEVPTWCTPTVLELGNRSQVIANGYKHSGGYDLPTGKEIWKLKGGGDIPVPTPVVAHDLIFLTSAHGPMAPIYAIKTTAEGDISLPSGQTTNEHIAWSTPRRGNYMQTPIVVGELLYCCNDAGVLSCYEARTGVNYFAERLGAGGDGFTASAISADGKLYCTSEQGKVFVVKVGQKFEVIATNDLGETCMTTPAISAGALFFRTRGHLVAIGEKAAPVPKK